MKRSLLVDIVISVVSSRTCVRATMWFVLMVVFHLRCSVVLLFMSPRTSHRCVAPQSMAARRAHAPHSIFHMDHFILLSLFLAHFLISLCFFCVSQAVLFTCFSFCCFTLNASLTRLPVAACSGCLRVLVLIDSSWRKVWSHARPRFRMSHPLCVARILLPFSNVGTMVTEPSIDWLQTH